MESVLLVFSNSESIKLTLPFSVLTWTFDFSFERVSLVMFVVLDTFSMINLLSAGVNNSWLATYFFIKVSNSICLNGSFSCNLWLTVDARTREILHLDSINSGGTLLSSTIWLSLMETFFSRTFVNIFISDI